MFFLSGDGLSCSSVVLPLEAVLCLSQSRLRYFPDIGSGNTTEHWVEQSSGTETRQTLTAEREGGERDQTDPGSRERGGGGRERAMVAESEGGERDQKDRGRRERGGRKRRDRRCRKSGEEGKSVGLGGRRVIKRKKATVVQPSR